MKNVRKYTYKEWQRKKCEKLGHDWALQDCDTMMAKVCLRCGATQIFFPEEIPEEIEEEPKIWGQTWSDEK